MTPAPAQVSPPAAPNARKKPRQLPRRRRRWRNLAGPGSPVPPWVSPPHPVLTSARSPSARPGSGRAAAPGDGKWQEKWGERKSSRSPWKPGEAPCRCEERGWGRSPGSPCHPPAGAFVGTQPLSCSGVAVPWRLAVPMPGAPIASLALDGDPAHPKPAGRAGRGPHGAIRSPPARQQHPAASVPQFPPAEPGRRGCHNSQPQGWEGPGAQEILLALGTPAPKKQEMPDLLRTCSGPVPSQRMRPSCGPPVPKQSRAPAPAETRQTHLPRCRRLRVGRG